MAASPAPYLQEFAPLDEILASIDHNSEHDLPRDVEWTCIDVTREYVVIGTNSSIVCLYDRQTGHVKKLNVKVNGIFISKVKLICSIDYEIAVGTSDGQLFIYVLPSVLPGKNKKLHVFTISGMHSAPISCLEWSRNAMKLFSGDNDGKVVCTEVDYTESTSKSYVACQEPCEIAQLSYADQKLLVSSTSRTMLLPSDRSTNSIQVGSKNRKILGQFGAVFEPNPASPKEPSLYTSRPGLRLWQARLDGKVTATYIFKDLVTEQSKNVSLLPGTTTNLAPHIDNCQFGLLIVYQESYLLSYHGTELYVIDPLVGTLTSYHTNLGVIQDVAVCNDEVFVLRKVKGRILIRLAHKPQARIELTHISLRKDVFSHSKPSGSSPSQLLNDTASRMSQSFIGIFKGVGETLHSVHEVHKTNSKSRIPPWGAVTDGKCSEPCLSGSTGSIDEVVDSAQKVTSMFVPSSKKLTSNISEPEQNHPKINQPSQSESKSRNSESKDPLTIVTLDGDQLTVITIEHSTASENRKTSQRSPSLMNTAAVTSSKSDDSELLQTRHTIFDSVGQDDYEELVFSRKTKKLKKKKLKPDIASIKSMEHSSNTSPMPPVSTNATSVLPISTDATSVLPVSTDATSAPHIISISTDVSSDTPMVLTGTSQSKHVISYTDLSNPSNTKPYSEGSTPSKCSTDDKNKSKMGPVITPKAEKNITQKLHIDLDKLKSDASIVDVFGDEDVTSGNKDGEDKSSPITDIDEDIPSINKFRVLEEPSLDNGGRSNHCGVVDVDESNIDNNDVLLRATADKEADIMPLPDDLRQLPEDMKQLPEDVKQLPEDLKPLPEYVKSLPEDVKPLPEDVKPLPEDVKTLPEDVKTLPEDVKTLPEDVKTLPDDVKPIKLKLDLGRNDAKSGASQSSVGVYKAEVYSPDLMTESSGRESVSDCDDFYSLYNAQPFSPTSPCTPQGAGLSLEAAIEYVHKPPSIPESSMIPHSPSKQSLADSWMEFTTPANVQSMCLSNRYIWFVDKKFHVHHSTIGQPGLRWNILPDPAKQLVTSPDGWIVWRLHKNVVYVGTNIMSGYPAGKHWRELARDVAYISVDDTVAWYIKLSGDIAMHKGLSRSRPCNRYNKVECPHEVMQVTCRYGVVWALTTDRNIIVRVGIKAGAELGTDWVFLQGEGPCHLVSSFALGDKETAWILDLVGRVWFTTGVTPEHPSGSGHWWQVSMSEYLMQDSKACKVSKSRLDVSQSINRLISSDPGGIICAGSHGVWLCAGYNNILHVCRGSLMGHRWENCIFSNMISSTRWLHVSATAVIDSEGMIWVQQSSGSLFSFSSDYRRSRVMEIPAPVSGVSAHAISATQQAVWLLMADGKVYVRTEMGAHCPQGIRWAILSLTQLDSSQLIHLSCGSQTVWAVSNIGDVYMRIGVQAPGASHLSPAWVPVDGCPKNASAQFTKVYVGTDDKMVWALDNKMCVYVRRGISDQLPLGKYWSYVSGTQALSLCVSNDLVYALNKTGEVLVRYGISEQNIDGDYWKKIPGVFNSLSVTGDDQLWAIDKEDLLFKRHLYYLNRQSNQGKSPPRQSSTEEDWELL